MPPSGATGQPLFSATKHLMGARGGISMGLSPERGTSALSLLFGDPTGLWRNDFQNRPMSSFFPVWTSYIAESGLACNVQGRRVCLGE